MFGVAAADELTHQVLPARPATSRTGPGRNADIRELHFYVADHAGLGEQGSPRDLLIVESLFGLLRDGPCCAMAPWGAMASMNSAVVSVTFHALRFIGHLPFPSAFGKPTTPFPEGKSIADGLWSRYRVLTAWASLPKATA